jgi:tetratricopeptide (TPR) repeat protein
MLKRILISSSLFAFRANLILLTAISSSYAQQFSEETLLSNQVQQLLINTNQTVNTETVDYFAKKIIPNRQYYSNDVIAKVYLLLARDALKQGDIDQVSDYVQQGLAANGVDKRVNLALKLKLAEVYIANQKPQELLSLTELVVKESQLSTSLKYQLMALSYRSVAYAMQGKHRSALKDLQRVERGLSNSALIEHIDLLTILAKAYHQLEDYQTSRIMLLKVLKLSVQMKKNHKLAQTHLSLGFAYLHLQRFDDAYNAFWESKNFAQKQQAKILVAHANKWLGIVLVKQKQFKDAFSPLLLAIDSYGKYNLRMDQVEAIIALAKARLEFNQTAEGVNLLTTAIDLLNGDNVSTDFTGFYRMVAEMHFAEQRYQMAYKWQEKHSRILLKKVNKKNKTDTIAMGLSELFIESGEAQSLIDSSNALAIKFYEQSELSKSLSKKNKQQGIIIFLLSLILFVLIVVAGVFLLKTKHNKKTHDNEGLDKSKQHLAASMKTKQHYQLIFKKAKKFHYPLNIAYLTIENWQTLIFQFNKKNIVEVQNEIASLINSLLAEFDFAGQLNEGEYLLLFEHQTLEEVKVKLNKVVQAINTRSFANLGDFSLIIKHSLKVPDYKDIDPYLFLASTIEMIDGTKSNKPVVE